MSMVFSPQYLYVRGRQLEGTFPGNRQTGIWPITSLRVGRGLGFVPEDDWPYNTSVWPPIEPPGLDAIASKYRLNTYYRRVRSVTDCKAVLSLLELTVIAAFEITNDWNSAHKGKIPQLNSYPTFSGSHSVHLIGYDDSKGEIEFQNSWGKGWGNGGLGYMPYEVFENTSIECWIDCPITHNGVRHTSTLERAWGIQEPTGYIVHCREFVGPHDEPIAWAFAVQNEDAATIDVEEIFVMPAFRCKGYGRQLVGLMKSLAKEQNAALRIWVSHADCARECRAITQKFLYQIGFRCDPSPVRWASFVASEAS